MTQKDAIKLFEERKIRTVWDEDQEKWYFSVVDIVSVLTDSANPTDYLKKVSLSPLLERNLLNCGWHK